MILKFKNKNKINTSLNLYSNLLFNIEIILKSAVQSAQFVKQAS